jgi:hypothetical protein
MKPYQFPRLDQLPENVQTFWEEKQNELGERLLLFSYAIFVNPAHFPLPEKSGILYLMEQNLWFEDFPKPPLFFLNRTSKYKKTLIQIPRQTIATVELIKQSGLEEVFLGKRSGSGFFRYIAKLMSPEPTYLFISESQNTENPSGYAFREINDPKTWLQALQK